MASATFAPPSAEARQTETIRWNPSLSKLFDVTQEQFPPASAEEALVAKYLGVDIKQCERRRASIPSVRMGAFLTALDNEAAQWLVDDVRNLDWQGRETTPQYDTIELNSKLSSDFLVDGMRFMRREESGRESRVTCRVQPRWYGLDVTTYGLRSAGTAETLLSRVRAAARDINFLKGEAFSLSGEFLPKTHETFSDLFLDTANAAAVERVVKLINERGKALENRGVLLMGPPGTGKTLSARIVRNEAQATFIWVSSRDFHYAGSFGGFAEAFDLARECAPSVLVFEDVDNWLYDTTVDLLKTEMDGVSRSSGVVTMMTTNYPELLPAALIDRPGRFHDVLRFGLPDAKARGLMLKRWLPALAEADVTRAVDATEGYSGAHVRELARFATIIAEQDGLPLGKALTVALQKIAEQRDLISNTQRAGSRYRMPTTLAEKMPRRWSRTKRLETTPLTDSMASLFKASSRISVKEVSDNGRKFSGIATSPRPDRDGDVIEPMGLEFQNPLPLLLFHDNRMPVGSVVFGKPTKDGVPFTATIPDVTEAGRVKELTDQAAHSVKYGLIRAVSIGFRAFMDNMEAIRDGGWRFLKTEVFELSLVPIPANPDAVIHSKATNGREVLAPAAPATPTSGVTGTAVHTTQKDVRTAMKKTLSEQVQALENKRAANVARVTEIQTKAIDDGRSKTTEEKEEFDNLNDEVKSIDVELVDLKAVEAMNRAAAAPVAGAASVARGSALREPSFSVISVKSDMPPGFGFARAILCKAAAFLSGGSVSPLDVAKSRYPSDDRVHAFLKGAVAAGTTLDSTWAGPFVDPTNLVNEFLEYQRPFSIIGKFGTTVDGVIYPALNRVPFNIRLLEQTSGGDGYWVGQGKPKPLTKFDFAAQTLLWAKVAALAVLTEELVRFSVPNAEQKTRDALRKALTARLDRDFLNPALAAVTNVSPASITYGLTPLSSAGPTADNIRADLIKLLAQFVSENNDPTSLVLIMPSTLALALSIMTNALGQPEFPKMTMRGGYLQGIPVIASQHAAFTGGPGNLVVAVNAEDVMLADDGQVSVDASREASLEMLDSSLTQDATNGTGASLVSLWQNNLIGLKAERFINWKLARAAGVSYLDDVNWGSVGSPS